MQISIIVPVYNSSKFLELLANRITESLTYFDSFEVILVDDGSNDESWDIIQSLAVSSKNFRGVRLSRNFGQHIAILCGMDNARGDWTIVMDADLQDEPETILPLYQKAIESGMDAVIATSGVKSSRHTSRFFRRAFRRASGLEVVNHSGNFGIYSRRIVEAVKSLGDKEVLFPALVQWVGFPVTTLTVQRPPSDFGTNYNFSKRLRLALQALIWNSNKILHVSIFFGFMSAFLALLSAIALLVLYSGSTKSVPGWTSTMVTIFFVGGLSLMSNGILGVYVGKIFDSIKARPRYIASDRTD